MRIPQGLADEIGLLLTFPTDSRLQGIKVHQDADLAMIAACKRLYEKGVIDQPDGGYLTDFGLDLTKHAQMLVSALREDS